MKVDIALVAVEHAVRIFVLSNYFLHYAMLHKLEVLGNRKQPCVTAVKQYLQLKHACWGLSPIRLWLIPI